MATFLICHGAWSAGWSWKKVRPLLRAAGHDIHTPTYTGLGERAHLSNPRVDLDCHIEDVLAVIHAEDLSNVILVGHSYGGMVATGVADQVPERLRALIYLDAFVPADGQCLTDLLPTRSGPGAAAVTGADWLIAPNPPAADTTPADLAWIMPRRRPQPARTFMQPIRLRHDAPDLPRAYIYCTQKASDDPFRSFADRFRADPRWRYHEIDAGHGPNVTAPEALVRLLSEIERSV